MDEVAEVLGLLAPEDLFIVRCCVDSLEQSGEIAASEAARWKDGIFGLMDLWGLEPDDLVP